MIGFDALPPPPKTEVIRQFLAGRMLPSSELCDLIKTYGRQCFEAGRNDADAKDAARLSWLNNRLLSLDTRYGEPPRCVITFLWPETAEVGIYLRSSIDGAML